MSEKLIAVKSCLPGPLTDEILKFDTVNEIHLRADLPCTVSAHGKNIPLKFHTDKSYLAEIFRDMCKGSVYAQSDNIASGYISLPCGIRVGVCGTAVLKDGNVCGVHGISSLNIRIPHAIYGAGDTVYALLKDNNFNKSILICSSPGVGKTTMLKDLMRQLASGISPLRVAVADERFELYDEEMHKGCTLDVYRGYPKAYAMDCALRTMAPQIMVCDEIGSTDDFDAIMNAQNSGVPCIASAHARDISELYGRPDISSLLKRGCFDFAVFISRKAYGMEFDTDIYEIKERGKCIDI